MRSGVYSNRKTIRSSRSEKMLNGTGIEVCTSSEQPENTNAISQITLLQQYYLPQMKQQFSQSYKGMPNPECLIESLNHNHKKLQQSQNQLSLIKSLLSNKQTKIKQLLSKGAFSNAKSTVFDSNRVMSHSQSLIDAKLTQFLFRLKVKMTSALQELQIPKTQFAHFEELNTETQIVETFVGLLKKKIRGVEHNEFVYNMSKNKQRSEWEMRQSQLKLTKSQLQQARQSQSRLKSKAKKLIAQNSELTDRLRLKEKEISEIHSQIYNLKVKSTHCSKVIDSLHETIKNKEAQLESYKEVLNGQSGRWKEYYEQQVKSKIQLKTIYDQVAVELEETLIKKQKMTVEIGSLQQELVRWKDRCQWAEIQKKNLQQRTSKIQFNFKTQQGNNNNDKASLAEVFQREKDQLIKDLKQAHSEVIQLRAQKHKIRQTLHSKDNSLECHVRQLEEKNSWLQKEIQKANVNTNNDRATQMERRMFDMANQWRQKLVDIISEHDSELKQKDQLYKEAVTNCESLTKELEQVRKENLRIKEDFRTINHKRSIIRLPLQFRGGSQRMSKISGSDFDSPKKS